MHGRVCSTESGRKPPDSGPAIFVPPPLWIDQADRVGGLVFQRMEDWWKTLEQIISRGPASAEGLHPVPAAGQDTILRGPAPSWAGQWREWHPAAYEFPQRR